MKEKSPVFADAELTLDQGSGLDVCHWSEITDDLPNPQGKDPVGRDSGSNQKGA